MKDLTTGKACTWRWTILYGKDGNEVGLYHTEDRAVVTEIIVCNRWVEFILFHIPGGYWLWNKLLCWTTTKETRVFSMPATKEMLAVLAPDDRWLWDEDYVEEEDESA